MSLKAYWAYEFNCAKSIDEILAVFNVSGPWYWEMGDSAWYGDYLDAHPVEGVRVRIHEFPEADVKYTALLQIKSESPVEQAEIDEVCKSLLNKINARDTKEIDPYD